MVGSNKTSPFRNVLSTRNIEPEEKAEEPPDSIYDKMIEEGSSGQIYRDAFLQISGP